MIWRWLQPQSVAMGTRPMTALRRTRRWYDRWPAWAVSLAYVLRAVAIVAIIFGSSIVAGEAFGRSWKYVTFGSWLLLVLWGYVHDLVRAERTRNWESRR